MSDSELQSTAPEEVQAKAREIGWRPPTKFKGDPQKWVDADEYLRPALIEEIRARLDTLPADINGVAFHLERFFMGAPSTSNGQQQRGDVIEREGGCNEHRRDPECGPDEAAGDERCAGGTVGAGSPRLPVDEVEAVSEDASGCSDEQWFIRRERRQIADPGATDAEAEQD